MALIKCPECEKDVSDKSTHCIHCGFPIKEIIKETTQKTICPYCGNNKELHENSVKYGGCCEECMVALNVWLLARSKGAVCKNCGKKGGDIEIDNTHIAVRCKKCKELIAEKVKDPEFGILLDVIIDREDKKEEKPATPYTPPTVRCPKCSSTQITTGSRGYSLAWGFIGARKTINRCANCGHKWEPHR